MCQYIKHPAVQSEDDGGSDQEPEDHDGILVGDHLDQVENVPEELKCQNGQKRDDHADTKDHEDHAETYGIGKVPFKQRHLPERHMMQYQPGGDAHRRKRRDTDHDTDQMKESLQNPHASSPAPSEKQ